MNIKINDRLFERLNDFRENTSFANITDLIEFIIEDYLACNNPDNSVNDSEINQDRLNQRLKDLGYF